MGGISSYMRQTYSYSRCQSRDHIPSIWSLREKCLAQIESVSTCWLGCRPDGAVEEQTVKAFGPGDSFGELALMYNCPRTATIRARTDVVLWSLDRVSFKLIVLEANTKKATMYESFLEKVQLLEHLSKDQRNRMVDALEEVTYQPGDHIIEEDAEVLQVVPPHK